MPPTVGYQATLNGLLQERTIYNKKGSITLIQVVYVHTNDLTDPGPPMTFTYLDNFHLTVSFCDMGCASLVNCSSCEIWSKCGFWTKLIASIRGVDR